MKEFTWDDIYNDIEYHLKCVFNLSINSLCNFINIQADNYSPSSLRRTYDSDMLDLLSVNHFEKELDFILKDPYHFCKEVPSGLKAGTLDTLSMLYVHKDCIDTVLLIWVSAFLFYIDNERNGCNISIDGELLSKFSRIVWSKFSDLGLYRWSNRSTEQLPLNNFRIIFRISKIDNYHDLIEFISFCFYLIFSSYKMVVFENNSK